MSFGQIPIIFTFFWISLVLADNGEVHLLHLIPAWSVLKRTADLFQPLDSEADASYEIPVCKIF